MEDKLGVLPSSSTNSSASSQRTPPILLPSPNVPALSPAVAGFGSTQAGQESHERYRSRAPNWCDAETRFLLGVWRERLPISKRRNSSAWAFIAKQFNKLLAKHGLSNFRSGVQCKSRMKYLEDEYKRAKSHKGRSGNKRQAPFVYFEEMDAALSCTKPQTNPIKVVRIAPRCEHPTTQHPTMISIPPAISTPTPVAEFTPTTAVHSTIITKEQTPLVLTTLSLPASPQAEFTDSAATSNDEEVAIAASVTNSVPRGEKRAAEVTQHAGPPAKSAAPTRIFRESSFAFADLAKFLEQSQKREHEFFRMLMEKEGERELQRQKMMVDMVKEIAKIVKGDK